MKFIKTSSIVVLSLLCLWICTPHLSAKQHSHHHYHKHRSRSSSFALNLNVDAYPRALCKKTYVYQPPVQTVQYYVGPPSYYSSAPVYRQVVVERPVEQVYVYPSYQYSYWGY